MTAMQWKNKYDANAEPYATPMLSRAGMLPMDCILPNGMTLQWRVSSPNQVIVPIRLLPSAMLTPCRKLQ